MMKYLNLICVVLLFGAVSLNAEEHNHDDHAGHDHAAHGEAAGKVLGDITINGCTLKVSSHSKLEAGKEFGVELVIEKGAAPAVLRGWIGVENARGSVKANLELDKSGKKYHVHLEAPMVMPENCQFWIESSNGNGEKSLASLALVKKTTGHDHKEGDGHDHGEKKSDDKGHDHDGHDH